MTYSGGYEKCAHLYDLFDTKDNIDFFAKYALKAKEILDVGAGTGRIAIPIAGMGARVICIEPSPAMRKEFAKKLALMTVPSANIEIFNGDAISFNLNRTFPAAFMSGSFDHLLNIEERLDALSNINKHLEDNGELIFDIFLGLMRNSPIMPAGKVSEGSLEYRRLVGSNPLDDNTIEITLIFETYSHGQLISQIEEKSLVGITNRQEIHNLLKNSGFQIRHEFGDYDFSPFKEGDSTLIIEAKKE